MYCNVIDGKIFFSSGKLIPLHGLRREFIDVAMVALQPEDDRWNKADADEWRKQRVTDAQLRVLANYPECQHHLFPNPLPSHSKIIYLFFSGAFSASLRFVKK